MKHAIAKIKSWSTGLLVLSFVLGLSLSACTAPSNDADDDGEKTESAEGEAAEHPEGEHPEGEAAEHPEGEHPSDSTDTAGEHEADSTAVE